MQVVLKLAIAAKPHFQNNTNGGGGVHSQAPCQLTDAQQHIPTRILKYRPEQFLTLAGQQRKCLAEVGIAARSALAICSALHRSSQLSHATSICQLTTACIGTVFLMCVQRLLPFSDVQLLHAQSA